MNLPIAGSSDRRGHDRQPVRAEATLFLPGGAQAPARMLDIGRGGAGVVGDLNLKVGTPVRLLTNLLAYPTGRVLLDAPAIVRNCTLTSSDGGFRLGLEFESLSPAAQAALNSVLR